MIKAVVFDMFETLVTHYDSPLYFSEQMAADVGINPDEFRKLWRKYENERTIGEMTFEQVIEIILKENNANTPMLYNKIIHKRIDAKLAVFDHMHEEIIPMMEALKARGIMIGLITNCFSEEDAVIRRCPLKKYFDMVCTSYQEKMKKPDPQIFARFMEMLNMHCDVIQADGDWSQSEWQKKYKSNPEKYSYIKAEDCLYVGDGGSDELTAASDFGMQAVQAVWYLKDDIPAQSKRDPRFKQIESPLGVLDELLNV